MRFKMLSNKENLSCGFMISNLCLDIFLIPMGALKMKTEDSVQYFKEISLI